ncbi:hypothetical protein CXF95_25840 [Paraglaciecola sp. MB-3u-78]|nr:hypothetical protein CXF95_25840 [Paraglaciecola sp. MB-3u-78]
MQNHYTFSDYSQFSKALDSELLPVVFKASLAQIRPMLIRFTCDDNAAINSQPETRASTVSTCARKGDG